MQRRLKLLPLSTGRQYSASRNRDPASAGKAERPYYDEMFIWDTKILIKIDIIHY